MPTGGAAPAAAASAAPVAAAAAEEKKGMSTALYLSKLNFSNKLFIETTYFVYQDKHNSVPK